MAVAGRPAWVDDELFPFESRFVAVDGHTVHYVDEGSGPTLLFLHGNPTCSFVYRDVIRSLRDGFRCVAVDYPGFGLSSAAPGYRYLPEEHAQVIAAFVDTLALSGVTLVAHDWGGPIGLATVEQQPAAFDRLVLANTWAWADRRPSRPDRFSPDGWSARTPADSTVQSVRQRDDSCRAPAEEADRRRDGPLPKGPRSPERRDASAVFARRITGSRAFLADVEGGLSSLASLPTLIVWGDADVAFGSKELGRCEQIFTNHQTAIVEGAGHFVQSDAPERFAATIRDWHAHSIANIDIDIDIDIDGDGDGDDGAVRTVVDASANPGDGMTVVRRGTR